MQLLMRYVERMDLSVHINQGKWLPPLGLLAQLLQTQPYEVEHFGSFTVSEPMFYIEVTIVPDQGYTAGLLNHTEEITLDRDITISANPATIQTFDDPVDVYWYVKDNSREAPLRAGDHFYANLTDVEARGIPLVFGDPDCELYGENASPRI